MNRDEKVTTVDPKGVIKAVNPLSAKHMADYQFILGSMATEIMGSAPSLDLQSKIDAAVSRATSNSRKWDKKTIRVAAKAARPVVERDFATAGKSFTQDEVRTSTKVALSNYAKKYGVVLPDNARLGTTHLEAVAGDVCGVFGLPWLSFMPQPVQVAAKAAEKGSPKAKSFLARLFGGGKKAPAPAVPAPAVAAATPAAVTPAAPAATALATKTAGDDESGAWLHMLNPLYWTKSAEERKLIDSEREGWKQNADAQKALAKRSEVLEQAQKALQAKQATEAAKAQAAALETQLKSIETQLSGAGVAEIMGRDEGAEDVDQEAIAPVLNKVKKARELNKGNQADLNAIAKKLATGKGLEPAETSKLMILLARNEQLHDFRKGLVSGEAYAQNPARNHIAKCVVVGSVKAMTPTEQKMMVKMVQMAKTGNANAIRSLEALKKQGYAVMGAAAPKTLSPKEKLMVTKMQALAKTGNANAIRALTALQKQGYSVMGGAPLSDSGFGIADAFNYALKPVTVPLSYAWKGTKWAGNKIFGSKGQSAEQVRLNRLQAAAKRRQAAQARARAADAQSEAEYRVQQQMAAAADAEADAADAEATAKEAAMETAEAQFMPSANEYEYNADAQDQGATPADPFANVPFSQSGAAAGATKTRSKAAKEKYLAKKNPMAATLLAKSRENTPEGIKLRASMDLYKKAQNRKSKERKAVQKMVARAKKGDKQALADVQALKTAGQLVKADTKASRHVARVAAYKATSAKVKAANLRMQVRASDALIRKSRAHQLAKAARIERKAACGDKKAQAKIKKVVAAAKAGDKNAQQSVKTLRLVKTVRLQAPTRHERRNIAKGQKLAHRIRKGDKRALAQARILKAAADKGNPNAKRAMKRLKTGAAVELALATGAVVLPAGIVLTEAQKKKAKAKQAKQKKQLASLENKISKGRASREEAQAAAKAAADMGDVAKSRELSATAATLPSAKDELSRVASVAAASGAGRPESQASIAKATEMAKAGDPKAIEAVGTLAGVKALNDISQGKDVSPEMKTAARDMNAAENGDAQAQAKIAEMQTKAKEGDNNALKYVVAATGAAVISRAVANNEKAQDEWHEKVGIKKPEVHTELEDTVLHPQKPEAAPLFPLAYQPLAPITGLGSLLKESVKALLLIGPDPFQNYREGVASLTNQTLGSVADTAGAAPAKDAKVALKAVAKTKKKMVKDPSHPTPGELEAIDEELMPGLSAEIEARRVKVASVNGVGADSKSKVVEDTKTRLAKLKETAKSNPEAAKKWAIAQANFKKANERAAKGDAKAKAVAEALKATGLFT